MTPRQRAHRATTAQLRAVYPFMAQPETGAGGVHMGIDLCGGGGAFLYDPWSLYGRGLTNPGAIVMGEVGEGKSALVKTYVLRQLAHGRRAVVLSVKAGEIDRLCEVAGGAPIRLEPGGRVRLNPLDPRVGGCGDLQRLRLDQLELLTAIASAALERELSPVERTACQLALDEAASSTDEPTLPAVIAALLRPTRAAASAVAMPPQRLADESRDVALELRRLCQGDLRGMFDGPTAGTIALHDRLVAFDLSAVYASPALAILMTCTAAWLHRSLVRPDATKRILVVDEAWAILRNLAVARWLAASWKLARTYGVQCIAVIHRLSDLSTAGGTDSEQVRLARGLLADSETRVIHSLRPEEVDATRELLDLTEAEAAVIRVLPRGTALWKVGDRSVVVEHRLSALERWVVDTDTRMREAPP